MHSVNYPLVGSPQVTPIGGGVADTDPRLQPGTMVVANDPWWGGGEFIYGKANGAIRQYGLVTCLPTFDSTNNRWDFDMVEAASTAILGVPLYVAVLALADNQYGWFQMSGLTPVNCNASVAADTTFSVAATGQGGAAAAGKQVVNARVAVAATATVAKANCTSQSASRIIQVPNSEGWFPGAYLSGTGVAAATKIVSIDPSGRFVTVSVDTTAAIAGTVTATYNNATIFYNIAMLNRPFSQGAIT